MPKIPMDYSKTIIYKIVCDDPNVKDCYVGHTTDMTKRKWAHKSVCNNEKNKGHNLKIYKIIRENGGWDNWTMLLVEKFACKDKHEACKREREIFEELDAKMNTFTPYLTHEETKQIHKQYNKQYREDHKQQYKQYYQQYREEHQEQLKQYIKQYREEHQEEIKEQYKKYYQEHKEKIKQYSKQYNKEHQEEIKQYKKQHGKQYYQEHKAELKEKIQCEFCSKLITKYNMSRHHKTCKSKSNSICLHLEKNLCNNIES